MLIPPPNQHGIFTIIQLGKLMSGRLELHIFLVVGPRIWTQNVLTSHLGLISSVPHTLVVVSFVINCLPTYFYF